jgi:hypothetical protein
VCSEVLAELALFGHVCDSFILRRYQGGAKQGGPQYPQAIVVGDSLHVIFSVNKEVMYMSAT